jgi:hypothetical protein
LSAAQWSQTSFRSAPLIAKFSASCPAGCGATQHGGGKRREASSCSDSRSSKLAARVTIYSRDRRSRIVPSHTSGCGETGNSSASGSSLGRLFPASQPAAWQLLRSACRGSPLAEDTIITWTDAELQTDIALSFQEAAGCNHVWEQIQDVHQSGDVGRRRGAPSGPAHSCRAGLAPCGMQSSVRVATDWGRWAGDMCSVMVWAEVTRGGLKGWSYAVRRAMHGFSNDARRPHSAAVFQGSPLRLLSV